MYKNNKAKIVLSSNKSLFYFREAFVFLFTPWYLLGAKWLQCINRNTFGK